MLVALVRSPVVSALVIIAVVVTLIVSGLRWYLGRPWPTDDTKGGRR